MCRDCRDWLMRQPAFVPLRFIPLQSPDIAPLFPGIDRFKLAEQLIVVGDDGSVYRGASAWVMCLWALQDYRALAVRLANPLLLPLARTVYQMISRNRSFISRWLIRRNPEEAARVLCEHDHCENC